MAHTDTGEPAVASPPKSTSRRALVPVLASCGTSVSLMNTLPIPMLPHLPDLLGTSATSASWVVTATLLAAAVCTPISGRLGDMYGKRRVTLCCLSLMVGGSLLCSVADSVTVLVIGRALQGCAAGILPLGLSIMRDVVPPERLGRALALMSSSVGLGGAAGFPLSALMTQHLDWHAVYWTATALSLANLLLVRLVVPASPKAPGGKFDLPGALGLTVVLTLLLLGISRGAEWGWASLTTVGAFCAAAVTACAWALHQLRCPAPLVDLRASAGRPLLTTNAASLLVGFSMFAMSMILPQLLQLPRATGYGSGLSMVGAGLCLAPAGVVMMLFSPLSARSCARWGATSTLAAGAAVIGFGYAAGVPLRGGVWGIGLVSVVIGMGLALVFAAMPVLIVASVPPDHTAAANGLNTLMRSIGMTVSSAVMTEILVNATHTATAAPGTAPVPSALGFRIAFAAAALAAAAAVGLAATHPDRRSGTSRGAPPPRGAAARGPRGR
ncbi:MFS transporter [Streptomyces venezuelae]|uniref:MFS transporter n=1 Tax=Streptomyces venezuelae TaxID=54571 RepID=UPI0036505361